MASVYELANLSCMAYDWKKNSFYEWHRETSSGSLTGEGFYSELYYNPAKNEAAMAIRGTDFEQKDINDFYSDVQLGLGNVPAQHKQAMAAYDDFRGYLKDIKKGSIPFFFTGHSLGGGLASLLAAKLRSYQHPYFVVTFNSPGMEEPYIDSYSPIDILDQTIGRYNYEYFFDKTPFLHLRADGDIVSLIGKHIGKVEKVYVDDWGDNKMLGSSRHLAQHDKQNMVNALERLPWYQKDIKKEQIHGTEENFMMAQNERNQTHNDK